MLTQIFSANMPPHDNMHNIGTHILVNNNVYGGLIVHNSGGSNHWPEDNVTLMINNVPK